jgi:putative transposase
VPQVRQSLRRRQPRRGDKWHLDEVFLTIKGKRQYLCRAVDQDGNVLDILVASRRDARSAKRFFRKLMKGVAVRVAGARLRQAGQLRRRAPRDPALGGTLILEVSDNRAENSHQPTRYTR